MFGGVKRLANWIGNNACQVDVAEAEAALREAAPQLLQDGEKLEMAFKVERDHFYFTNKRILFRNKKGVSGQKVNYKSIPYSCIKAFAVETGGSMDLDAQMTVWCSGLGSCSMDFVKEKVDLFAVQRFMNSKVLHAGTVGKDAPTEWSSAAPAAGSLESVLNWLGDDATQLDAGQVEQRLKGELKLLVPEEHVQLAFKSGRDSILFTTHRIFLIDVKGFTGKKIEYLTLLWSSVRAYTVETAGSWFDRDAQMAIWTNIKEMRVIKQDLRKGKADVIAIQRFLSNKLLGMDTAPASAESKPMAGHVDTGASVLAWFGDDARHVDAAQVDRQYHESTPILQGCEHVEMAVKGRRDMSLFTTKRLLMIDVKGISGKKVKYISVPWSSIKAFAVRSAGSMFDKDSEMMLWTDIMHDPPPDSDSPPEPGMSYLEQDFQKDKVDLMAIKRYLTSRCMPSDASARGAAIPKAILQATPAGAVDNLLSWLGNDARQIDPVALDEQLHKTNPMLQQDEKVVMAFKAGRDTMCLTSKRCLFIDVQGMTGSKVEYKSIPYGSLRAFSVESAGAWDRDAEVELYVKSYWMPKVSQDLRKGKADVIALQDFLAAQLLGGASRVSAAGGATIEVAPGGAEAFLGWLCDNAHQVDAAEVDSRLHSTPPILQSDEKVDLAFKSGRDLWVFTTKRILLVDVKGLTGKKVEYFSLPLRYCTCFAVQSAGKMDWDAEAAVYTDIPAKPKLSQDLWKGKTDIFVVHKQLASDLLRGS